MSDLIRRQDAIDSADEIIKRDTSGNNAVVEAMKAWKAYIGNLPSAERKRGIWMPIERGDKGYSAGDFICSCCGKPNKCYSVTDYCCSCGAKMERREA